MTAIAAIFFVASVAYAVYETRKFNVMVTGNLARLGQRVDELEATVTEMRTSRKRRIGQ